MPVYHFLCDVDIYWILNIVTHHLPRRTSGSRESSEAHYETVGNSSRLEGIGEDFSEIDRMVRGYLNSSSNQSGALTVSRTVPAEQIKEQTERLEQ